MLNITIATIPHAEQRYPTVGDWIVEPTPKGLNVHIRVSKLRDWRRELLVAIHELVEVSQLAAWSVKPLDQVQREVDDFDRAYEAKRPEGDTSEPGDHPEAPYRYEHFFATNVERLLCQGLGVDWADYDREVESL
jgi:hypothetical protein